MINSQLCSDQFVIIMEEKLLESRLKPCILFELHLLWFPFPFQGETEGEEWYLPNSLQFHTIVSAYFSVSPECIPMYCGGRITWVLQSRQTPSKQLECSAPSHESTNNCCDLWKSLKEELLWVINTTNCDRFAWTNPFPLLSEIVPRSLWENYVMHVLWNTWICLSADSAAY